MYKVEPSNRNTTQTTNTKGLNRTSDQPYKASDGRLLALILAIPATCWGIWVTRFISEDFTWLLIAVFFMPGYAITLGYWIRFFVNPTKQYRQLLWLLSCVIHAIYPIYWSLLSLGFGGLGGLHLLLIEAITSLAFWWWVFAIYISCLGLRVDSRGPEKSPFD